MTTGPRKPLVGIVGEIYVRNNVFANEHVVRSIEKLGAEAWMAPLAEWVLFTSSMWNLRQNLDQKFSKQLVQGWVKWHWLRHWERKLYGAAGAAARRPARARHGRGAGVGDDEDARQHRRRGDPHAWAARSSS